MTELKDVTEHYARGQNSATFIHQGICRLVSKGDYASARAMMEARGVPPRDLQVVDRAAVAGMTTGDSGLATSSFAKSFLAVVSPLSAFAQARFRTAPFNTQFAIEAAGAAPATWVNEGGAMPVVPFAALTATLRPGTLALIAPPMPVELARSSDPSVVVMIQSILSRLVALGVDAAAFTPADSRALTYGAAEIPATGNLAADMEALLGGISAGVPTRPVLIVGTSAARALLFSGDQVFANVKLTGAGHVGGVPAFTSAAPALATLVIAVDADAVVVADGGIELDQASAATLEMDSAPVHASADTASPPAPVHATLVSLWQTNSIAMRARRYLAWTRRDDAVAFTDLGGSPA